MLKCLEILWESFLESQKQPISSRAWLPEPKVNIHNGSVTSAGSCQPLRIANSFIRRPQQELFPDGNTRLLQRGLHNFLLNTCSWLEGLAQEFSVGTYLQGRDIVSKEELESRLHQEDDTSLKMFL